MGLHYVQSWIEALSELEALLAAAPIDYLHAYVSNLEDHRALEQLRCILCLLTSLKHVTAEGMALVKQADAASSKKVCQDFRQMVQPYEYQRWVTIKSENYIHGKWLSIG
ncbi:unnamed protein product [Victoria cruziana]